MSLCEMGVKWDSIGVIGHIDWKTLTVKFEGFVIFCSTVIGELTINWKNINIKNFLFLENKLYKLKLKCGKFFASLSSMHSGTHMCYIQCTVGGDWVVKNLR